MFGIINCFLAFVSLIDSDHILVSGPGFYLKSIGGKSLDYCGVGHISGEALLYNTILYIKVKGDSVSIGTVNRARTMSVLKVGNQKEMKLRMLCKSQHAAKNNSRYGHMAIKLENAFSPHRFQRIVKHRQQACRDDVLRACRISHCLFQCSLIRRI